MSTEAGILFFLLGTLGTLWAKEAIDGLYGATYVLCLVAILAIVSLGAAYLYDLKSSQGRLRRKNIASVKEIPDLLKLPGDKSVVLGQEANLALPIYLPNNFRARHMHILGATGSGKTESVILNLLGQDVKNGYGAILLDAKGDESFLEFLHASVSKDKLKVFDLSASDSCGYDPLAAGSPMEAAQRLFSSLIWSEEYYQSKAIGALQKIFCAYQLAKNRNPNLLDLKRILEIPKNFTDLLANQESYPLNMATADFNELSGLRDQVNLLCTEHLGKILSPESNTGIDLKNAAKGEVIYFRLQSLLSPRLSSTVGKLVIAHLAYMAGSAHREKSKLAKPFIPTFLDEFASFACPEFADLISKARSAGLALHFSHQSLGDLANVEPGFLSRIVDNSATKIILRVNDPETAETMARTFGTKEAQQITKRVTNAEDIDLAESDGAGSLRETREFRMSPDQLKTLPTGVGAVLISHGLDTPSGGASVFKIKFPKLESNNNK